jgi:hypothetical protein
MNDVLKNNMAEDTIRQKEIAKQMAKQMIAKKEQSNLQLLDVANKGQEDQIGRSKKLDAMLSDKDSSKSEFENYLSKIDGVMTTGIAEILTGKDRIASDMVLNSINIDDVIPVLAEHREILDASQEMAMALTNHDSGVSEFYDNMKDRVHQYNAEKAITLNNNYEQDDIFSFDEEQEQQGQDFADNDNSDGKSPYDLNAFVNFKDTFVNYFNHNKQSTSEDLKHGLHDQMNALVQEQSDQLQTAGSLLTAMSNDDVDSGMHTKGYKGINDKLYSSDSDFQEEQNTQFMFLQKLCPKGMMGAIMLAFFVAQQAMQENMKGPANEVYSTSAAVSRLSQFSSAMKKIDNTDDNGNKIKDVYRLKDGKTGNSPDDWELVTEPTPEDMAKWLLANANKPVLVPSKTDSKGVAVCGTTRKALGNLVDFIKQGARIFGSNLDGELSGIPTAFDKISVKDLMVFGDAIGGAYRKLMGTKSNGEDGNKNDNGIVATWIEKNDPNNAATILQILNTNDSYKLYSQGGENAFAQYNSAKDGLASGLSSATAALNLGQSQQNANNTAFYGWMKSWEDNAIEIARKTG